jgi:hypothetical protein
MVPARCGAGILVTVKGMRNRQDELFGQVRSE